MVVRVNQKKFVNYSELVWHKDVEVLNLVCVVAAHRGRLFLVRCLGSLRPAASHLPAAPIMSRGVKLRVNTTNRTNKTSPQLCLHSHSPPPKKKSRGSSLIFSASPSQRARRTRAVYRGSTTEAPIYIQTKAERVNVCSETTHELLKTRKEGKRKAESDKRGNIFL